MFASPLAWNWPMYTCIDDLSKERIALCYTTIASIWESNLSKLLIISHCVEIARCQTKDVAERILPTECVVPFGVAFSRRSLDLARFRFEGSEAIELNLHCSGSKNGWAKKILSVRGVHRYYDHALGFLALTKGAGLNTYAMICHVIPALNLPKMRFQLDCLRELGRFQLARVDGSSSAKLAASSLQTSWPVVHIISRQLFLTRQR